ncbi:MAG: hypothetical protein IJE23_04680 [Tyzzerella sp.]|nr:hypothetical protein [Tyzzerella sp.]
MERIITPNDGYQYFFGYYDLQPMDTTGRYHLTHRVKFMDRLPEPADIAELGAIDMESGEFVKWSETTAWNFQQGAMLRWYKDDEHIVYNVFDGARYRTEIKNIVTRDVRRLPMAFADISTDGRYAVCINFPRIYDFRPGYGYSGVEDIYQHVNAPADDGVWLMNMESGECRLIISYEQMKTRFPQPPYSEGKLLVNHITFNPMGNRFLFLLRNFPAEGQKWNTMLLTSDLQGNMYKLTDYCVNSHYHWKNDREILIVTSAKTDNSIYCLYLLEDLTDRVECLPEPNPITDIHCLYSPDRRYILGDGYPNSNGKRTLWLIDTETNEIIRAVDSQTVIPDCIDIRCDLHARWTRDGQYVTFDSTHTGKRTICMISLEDMLCKERSRSWKEII